MVSIDKTYTNSYVEYKEFKEWANRQFVTFFNGYKVCVGDWVWDYTEDDFNNVEIVEGLTFYIGDEYCKVSYINKEKAIATIVACENPKVAKTQLDFNSITKFVLNNRKIPIMNTPTWLDIYLIQNCKSKFVIERMKSVYDDRSFEEYQLVDLSKHPINSQQNRKIKIRRTKKTKFPIYNKPFIGKWWLQSSEFRYDTDSKTRSSRDMYYPSDANTSHHKTIKSLVRHLRKQYLPIGASFKLNGRCVGEEYLVVVT